MGDWQAAPSGQNQTSKLKLLEGEGVEFDGKGFLKEQGRWFDHFVVRT